MKNSALFILLLILSSSCNKDFESFALNEKIELDFGESAKIEDENISIEFVDVLEESRCPPGALCIWLGVVRVELNINGGEPVYIILGETQNSNVYVFDDYELSVLDVTYTSDKNFGVKDEATLHFEVREL